MPVGAKANLVDNLDTQPQDVMTLPTPSPPHHKRPASFDDANTKRLKYQQLPMMPEKPKPEVEKPVATSTAAPSTSKMDPPIEPPIVETHDDETWKVLHGGATRFLPINLETSK